MTQLPRIEKNILIVGAGAAGRMLAQDIRKNHPRCRVSGFIDDSPKPKVETLGKISDFSEILATYLIDEIVIAIPSADGSLVRRVLVANIDNYLPIKIVPRNQRIIGRGIVRYADVKDLEPNDFLGRPFVLKDVERLKRFYSGKTVFVTGGAGSIGSEIVRQLIDLEAKRVIVYDNSEYLVFMLEQQLKERGMIDRCDLIIGNVLNQYKLDRLFKEYKPDFVFHAAAYKHVHLMQDNVDESITNNVVGTKRVIDAAIENNIKVVTFISTDKVVNPTSVMGATKKLGEYYIGSLTPKKTQFNIVRFGNVINSNGSALPLWERQIELHRYVTITHKDMQRFFMSIREAAQLVIESTATEEYNRVHVLNMGELINIYEVAVSLIRAKNLIPGEDVEIRFTGLRKGEKMIEELYTEAEKKNLFKTKGSKILALKRNDECPFDIHQIITELEHNIQNGMEYKKLRKLMKDLFPSLWLPTSDIPVTK
jgi:FlaA1/EpsC-like NDP-sugar epimerase